MKLRGGGVYPLLGNGQKELQTKDALFRENFSFLQDLILSKVVDATAMPPPAAFNKTFLVSESGVCYILRVDFPRIFVGTQIQTN